jgi:hypothetical protein
MAYVTVFGKLDSTLKVVTRPHFHANMERFNIAFCLWAIGPPYNFSRFLALG